MMHFGQNNIKQKNTAKYRHEYKFFVSDLQLILLQSRLLAIMQMDEHVKDTRFYEIRSIYFDDIYNTCYEQNAAGTDPRAKYRIRAYNAKDDVIMLEKKIKNHGMTRKISCPLNRELYDLILAQEYKRVMELSDTVPDESAKKLLQEFMMLCMTRGFRPKVIVSYERIPFVEPKGNVRVTFDRNISSSTDFAHFFDKNLAKLPVMPCGRQLMEVKYDEFLPTYIKGALEDGRHRQTTFSKYYICRQERMRR